MGKFWTCSEVKDTLVMLLERRVEKRSPNDDSVRGTATVIDPADLRPALALAAVGGLMRSTR